MTSYRARIVFDTFPRARGGLVWALPSPVRSLLLVPSDPEVLEGSGYDSVAALIDVDGGQPIDAGQRSVHGTLDFLGGDEVRQFVGPGTKVDLRMVDRIVGRGVVGEEVAGLRQQADIA